MWESVSSRAISGLTGKLPLDFSYASILISCTTEIRDRFSKVGLVGGKENLHRNL